MGVAATVGGRGHLHLARSIAFISLRGIIVRNVLASVIVLTGVYSKRFGIAGKGRDGACREQSSKMGRVSLEH